MSYKVDESTLMAYLYGELSAEEHTKVEEYLYQHEEARKELEELKEARFLMGKLSDREIDVPKFTFDQPEKVVALGGSAHHWWKYPLGIAASIALILCIGYLTSFQVTTDKNGTNIAFGDRETQEETFTKDQVQTMINQALAENNKQINQRINDSQSSIAQQVSQTNPSAVDQNLLNEYMARLRNFNRETLRSMLEESEQSQKTYTDQSLRDLAVFLDVQRQNDMNVIQTRLESFEDDAEFNQSRTNRILTNLIGSAEEQPSNQY